MVKVALVLFLVGLAVAYDFKDSDFNEVIFRDLIELNDDADSAVLQRNTRAVDNKEDEKDEECKHRKRDRGFRCCNDKVDFKHLEIIKMAKKLCMAELHGNDSDVYFKFDPFTCEKLEELKKDVICIAECVGKKFAVLDEEGNIKRDIFLMHLKTKFAESEWKQKVADGIVDKCIEEAKNEVDSHVFKRETGGAKACNPTSLKVSQCLWREYVRACPKDLQTDSSKCNKLREKIEKGDDVTYKGFYLKHLNDDK